MWRFQAWQRVTLMGPGWGRREEEEEGEGREAVWTREGGEGGWMDPV